MDALDADVSRANLDVLMSMKEGRFVPQPVLDGLLCQGISFRLWISTAISDGDHARARNHIKQYATSQPYTLMLDNDVILPERALIRMIEFLDTHTDFAAIALSKGNIEQSQPVHPLSALESAHVDMSCVLFRTTELQQLTFDYPGGSPHRREGCECLKACQDIRNAGKRIGFLDGICARHLENTQTWVG